MGEVRRVRVSLTGRALVGRHTTRVGVVTSDGRLTWVIVPTEFVTEEPRPWEPGDGDTRCQICGHEYEPWFTDNWLWNTVMGGDPLGGDPGGCLCPRCFADRASRCYSDVVWRFIPEWSGKAPLMDFPARDGT